MREHAEQPKLNKRRLPRIRAALRKIRMQCPDIPEAKLLFAVFERAVEDTALMPTKADRKAGRQNLDQLSALHYLQGEMVHAQLCGLDPDWVRDILSRSGAVPYHWIAPRDRHGSG